MPRVRIASVAIATLVLSPACSFIIDTNPDGVIKGVGGKGAATAGRNGTGAASDGEVRALKSGVKTPRGLAMA